MAAQIIDASRMWTSELEKIHRDIVSSTQEIQSAFLAPNNANANANGKPSGARADADSNVSDSNPMTILHRIQNLETTIQKLHAECAEYAHRRPILAEEVTSLLLKNFKDIEKLTVQIKGREGALNQNIVKLAISTHAQNQSWRHCLDQENEDGNVDVQGNNDLVNDYGYDNVYDEAKEGENANSTHTMDHSSYSSQGDYHDHDHDHDQTINNTTTTTTNSTSFIDDETGTIIITNEQYQSIPLEHRGRCKLPHIQKVAYILQEEVTARYRDGYRNKNLAVERQQIAKYAARSQYPGLYAVIMNQGLWRDILSCLQFLGIVRVDPNEGTLMMTGI